MIVMVLWIAGLGIAMMICGGNLWIAVSLRVALTPRVVLMLSLIFACCCH